MYQFQNLLPKLPLPKLEETCDRYWQTVAPFLPETELEKTKAAVTRFQQGIGPELQKKLETILSSNHSYLYQLVEKTYLQNREALMINSNPGAVCLPLFTPGDIPFARKTAIRIHEALKFYLKVKNRQLKPDLDIFRPDHPLCMLQYNNLFGTSRIPGIKCDRLHRTKESHHIILIRRNTFYYLKLIAADNLSTVAEIARQIEWILERTLVAEPALGVLTAIARPQWAILRTQIAAITPENRRSLELLDSALFVVCLDETAPTDIEAASKNALHGNGQNRWFDKTLQLIFTPDGQMAINFDHAGIDGYTTMRFAAEVHHNCQQQSDSTLTTAAKFEPPTQLQWSLNPELERAIEQALIAVESAIAQNETRVLEFNECGQEFFTEHGLMAEAVIQLSIQLAYVRLHSKIACVSQSVHARSFQSGRWEDVRVVTPASVKFIQTSLETTPDAVRYSALNDAINSHRERLIACKQGQGIERHLFALYTLADLQGVLPDIFLDRAYSDIFCKPIVSTSSLAAGKGLTLFCFGPVVSYGYGIAYLIGSDRILFNVTSKYQQTGKFIELLPQAILELLELIRMKNRNIES